MILYKFKSILFFTLLFQMASSTIQNVSSCPDYINQFINHNFEKLNEILTSSSTYLDNTDSEMELDEKITLLRDILAHRIKIDEN